MVRQWSVSSSYGTPQLIKEYNLDFQVEELKLAKNFVYGFGKNGETVQMDISAASMLKLNTKSLGSDTYYAFSASPDNTYLYYATERGLKFYNIAKEKLAFQADNLHDANWLTEALAVSPNGNYCSHLFNSDL